MCLKLCCALWWGSLGSANPKAEPRTSKVKGGPLKRISFSSEESTPVKSHHANASQESNLVFLEPRHQSYLRSGCRGRSAERPARQWKDRVEKDSTDLAWNPWVGGGLGKAVWLCSSEI